MGHAKPHTPQFAGSVVVLVHTPLQLMVPGGHTVVHTLFTHVAPGAQTTPQLPQLRGSVKVSTHEPSAHWVWVGPQFAVQMPLAQTSPIAHARLQAPQLPGLVRRSTHWPLQSVVPSGQPAQVPF
jgi:hypothetical protein